MTHNSIARASYLQSSLYAFKENESLVSWQANLLEGIFLFFDVTIASCLICLRCYLSQITRKCCLIPLENFICTLFPQFFSVTTRTLWISHSNSLSALTNTPQRLRQNTFECSYMQNANIFLSATVPCYIAASLVIFRWILHLHFLSLSVCVIVSNAQLDLSLRSNRGSLPLPQARLWGLPV